MFTKEELNEWLNKVGSKVNELVSVYMIGGCALSFSILKNKLNYDKILPIAMKYSKYTMFENFVRLLDTKEDILNLDTLPTFDHKDFIRIADMYGVKHVY